MVKKILFLITVGLSACLPPEVMQPLAGTNVGITVQWPEKLSHPNFKLQTSYEEILKLGAQNMRIQLIDAMGNPHLQVVAFNSRHAEFKGLPAGYLRINLECLGPQNKVLFWGSVEDKLESNQNKTVNIPVKEMQNDQTPFPRIDFTNSLGMQFVTINPGSFEMGSPLEEEKRETDEQQHPVTLSKSFYLQTTEVTQGQWEAIMKENPSFFHGNSPNLPVESVSWKRVQMFISKLNQKGEGLYRLPTEAEWEYIARTGSKNAYNCGENANCLSGISWNKGNAEAKTHPVGQKQPNAWGLYDVYGNVSEWVNDWYSAYAPGQQTDPQGPETGELRVYRGESWSEGASEARSAVRHAKADNVSSKTLGFRLVREQ